MKRIGIFCLLLLVPGGSRLDATPAYPYAEQVRIATQRYGVEEALVRAVIKAESNFNPQARSHKGALGLMQLMPTTAYQYEPGIARFQLLEEPALNIAIGTRHLKTLERQVRKRYPQAQGMDQIRLVAAAYNAGWGRVVAAGGTVPPWRETQTYVRRVTRYYQRYGGRLTPPATAAPGPLATTPVPAPAHPLPIRNAAERAKLSTALTLLFTAYGWLAWRRLKLIRRRFAHGLQH